MDISSKILIEAYFNFIQLPQLFKIITCVYVLINFTKLHNNNCKTDLCQAFGADLRLHTGYSFCSETDPLSCFILVVKVCTAKLFPRSNAGTKFFSKIFKSSQKFWPKRASPIPKKLVIFFVAPINLKTTIVCQTSRRGVCVKIQLVLCRST